ncbi:MAG: hypothetical protein ABI921_06720 [Panacibacter sp.]
MLIAEGNKSYERDDKQRIIRILEPGTLTNRTDIQVYYKDDNSNEVLYTFCKLVNSLGTDSVVYLHDEDGKLVKTMSYFRDLSDNALSDVANLVQYDLFNYDPDGNLVQWDDYKVRVGFDSNCGSYSFNYYDKKRNPLYTGDEARTTGITWGGMLNNSANNCMSMGSYARIYDYRTDGRPRSCIAKLNGVNNYKLIFEYK